MAARMIIAVLVFICSILLAFVVLLYIKFGTDLGIPGWATTVGFGLHGASYSCSYIAYTTSFFRAKSAQHKFVQSLS